MRAGGKHREPVLGRPLGDLLPQRPQLGLGLLGRLDHGRGDLDERLEQLGLDPFRRFAEDAREAVACGLERLRVDEHQLLLHPKRPSRSRAEAAEIHGYLPRTPCTGRPAASHA